MDDLGLPIAFGKQKQERETHALPDRPAQAERGEGSSRGPRGSRNAYTLPRRSLERIVRPATSAIGPGDTLAPTEQRPPPSFVSGANRANFGARGGSARGGGGGGGGHRGRGERGGHGGGGHGGGGSGGGLWKESYVEDPWRGLTPRLAHTAGV
ncbi:uncharacterized protein LOC62_01G001640 [Vanrija pseudolonga]|uniref:Uncharacterized protein n=1 Tax=Vanrija pseudolonga TaxID=143232 RepID=A0AAF1BG32_9TREE|nr:hypothetical protein LOC62_01G001640 [Vanrija pseudolonga]